MPSPTGDDQGRPHPLVTLTDATTAGGRSRAQATAQLARSGRQATGDLVTPFAVSVGGADDSTPAELAAHLVCSPEASASPVPNWSRVQDGSDYAATPTRRQHQLRWARGAVVVRRHAPRGGDAEMTTVSSKPARIVDAHVHLWDPARTDWYPYLSGRRELDMGDVSGMSRRFDVPTYLAEAAGWNVEKLVNVAAATGVALDRRDARTRPAGRAVDGHPDAIIGGLPPTDSVAETVAATRPAADSLPVPGRPSDGRRRGVRSPRSTCFERCKNEICCSS